MKIEENQIKEKRLAGANQNGPVVYILTKGGLHSFFGKDSNGEIVSLAAAPHRAIGAFFAEQKDPSIKWNGDFLNKSDENSSDLFKNEVDTYAKYRNMIWSQSLGLLKSETSDIYFVYDIATKDIWVSDISEIRQDIKNNNINKNCVVRPIDLTEPPRILSLCDEFKE